MKQDLRHFRQLESHKLARFSRIAISCSTRARLLIAPSFTVCPNLGVSDLNTTKLEGGVGDFIDQVLVGG